jgi:phosphoglycolate phosphatase-like HAD superfamily hydrolase
LVETAIEGLRQEGLEIERGISYFVGDSLRDIQTGKASGLKAILVLSGREKAENRDQWATPPDFVARDLLSAVEIIVKET